MVRMVYRTSSWPTCPRFDLQWRMLIASHPTSFAEARNRAVYENWLGSDWITWDAEELPLFPAVPQEQK